MTPADQSVLARAARIAAGGHPRVIDLFSGCGGLSLGFARAGFNVAAAVEFDPDAAASHGANFHPGVEVQAQARDITHLTPETLTEFLHLGSPSASIDVLVGGPPCQAFARVGRSKLREIEAHPQAFIHDPRARLYLEYLRYVDAFKPLALLMENVPDVLNHGGQNVAQETCDLLEEKGYIARYTLLNASRYGVPQMRERMFLIAYRREIAETVRFPEPTHFVRLPPGYTGSRQVALKLLGGTRDDLPGFELDAHSYVEAPEAHPGLPPAVTAEDALHDLPPIIAHLSGGVSRGARRFDQLIPYDPRRKLSPFARDMRSWPGFENDEGVSDHVIRYLPRDWKLFGRLRPGDQYPEAHACAVHMFEEALATLVGQGRKPAPGSVEWNRLRDSIVPPYDHTKFPNKWRKMEADQPARTLMAHLGKDSYSHIHYDSRQSRTISVREAARLQSFPDGFVFKGTMNPAFRQIGNAVPPLMAFAIAGEIMKVLKKGAAEAAGAQKIQVAAAVG